MKATLIIIGAVILLVVIFAVLRAGKVAAPTNQFEEVEPVEPVSIVQPPAVAKTPAQEVAEQITLVTHQIELNSGGFTPNSLTIKRGDTVVFFNQSGSRARIPSNPHPIHSELPAFDSGELASGESYRFTFDKAGDFGVHNHFNISLTALITVL